MPRLRISAPVLEEGAIHVWYVDLEASPAVESSFEDILSAAEKTRCRTFATAALRRRYTLSHAVLRILLHRYLAVHPADLSFTCGPTGKPCLANPQVRLAFNLSHSDNRAAYAFGMSCQLGVDIERIRTIAGLTGVAQLAFSEKEFNHLQSFTDDEKTEAFFRCWTRKEAYIKATGEGLSSDLKAFTVSLDRDKRSMVEFSQPYEPRHIWHVYDLSQPGYSGSVVCDQPRSVTEFPPVHSAEAFAQSLPLS